MRNPVSRPLLAGIFIVGGYDAWKSASSKVDVAKPVLDRAISVLPEGTFTHEQLVKVNGATQIVGGAMLALGVLPRLATVALASSIALTTTGGHRFWELEDPDERRTQGIQLLKNAAIFGGLLASL